MPSRTPVPGVLRDPAFFRLWLGASVSELGSRVTLLALPLTAVLVLGAGPVEMGLLEAAQALPFLLFGLFIGVWVDRLPRRSVLVFADVGRALLLASIPAAALLGVLTVWQLCAVGFLAGTLSVFADLAATAYLPVVVDRSRLVEANGVLATSDSAATIAGPALGGVLVQLVTAPLAIAADACSFVASALLVGSVPATGAAPADGPPRRSVWHEIGEGLAWVVRHPVLRPLAACAGTFNVCSGMYVAGYVLFAARDLRLSPASIGLIDAVRGPGFLVGAAVVAAVARRLGFGTTVLLGADLMGIGVLAAPLLDAESPILGPALLVGFFVNGLGNPLYNVNASTLRQIVTPERLLGRTQAAVRFIGRGGLPLGAVVGGAVGGRSGCGPRCSSPPLGCWWGRSGCSSRRCGRRATRGRSTDRPRRRRPPRPPKGPAC